ncbi:MAG: dipeptide ABC transporter permease DppC [Actinomycetota bacterium]|nr:MAG: dipeptide ABC transporter permease DppC [Actinomycetota bacterium]
MAGLAEVPVGAAVRSSGGALRTVEWLAAGAFGLIVLLAILGPLLAPYPPEEQRFADGVLLGPGSPGHLLGTDQLARDLLSRLLVGTRVSLGVALAAVVLGLGLGLLIGGIAGMRGGWVDAVLMRAMDALLAFPALVLALVIAAALGPSLRTTVLAISIVMAPGFARLVRSLTLRERARDYVAAARASGASAGRIARVHILPNIWAPLGAQAALAFGHAIPAEAALSFLGLGVQLPDPSWGNMISEGYAYLSLSPWGVVLPSIMIVCTVASISILADGVRRALEV